MKQKSFSRHWGLVRLGFGGLLSIVIGLLSLEAKAQVIVGGGSFSTAAAAVAPQTVMLYLSIPDSTQIVSVSANGVPTFQLVGANNLVGQY